MTWRRSVSSTVLAPRARRVPPGLFPRPVPAPGLGARPLCRLSSALQWSVMRSPLARRSHPAPSTLVVSSSFEGRVRRCLHPLFHHLTVGRWPNDACWPLASSPGRCLLPNPEYDPVDVFDLGAGLGGWAGNLRPIHTRGRRHEHCCPVMTITLGNIKATTQSVFVTT